MLHFAVLGATSWGVTLAWLLERNGHRVTLVTRTTDEAEEVAANRGIARLPEVRLGPSVAAAPASHTSELSLDGLVAAVPAQALRTALGTWEGPRTIPLLSAAKGIELGTALRPSEVAIASGWKPGAVAVLSGPNLAHEVGRGLPAAAVIASDGVHAAMWQTALSRGTFRGYTSSDVIGVELGGALKNIVAIAAGAAWGLDFGANAVATIATRGLAEITRLGLAAGARAVTFQGLAGVGDLVATCFSPLSRNRRLGELLASGRTTEQALADIGEAVEGAATAPVALALAARWNVEMPITEQVAAVLAGQRGVREAMRELLLRPLRPESGHGA